MKLDGSGRMALFCDRHNQVVGPFVAAVLNVVLIKSINKVSDTRCTATDLPNVFFFYSN